VNGASEGICNYQGFASSLRWTAAIIASMSALLAPAIWNGFPLIFADTGGYLERPFEGTLALGRSALYGTFLALGIPLEFWPNAVIQPAVATWILAIVLTVHKIGRRPFLLTALVMALMVATSLPWYVGQLMPDVFLESCGAGPLLSRIS
jgi:hypothetical protein